MPKTPSRRLFDLIKSLSGSEKRYFRVASGGENDNKYWLLFRAIEQQDVFDEHALQTAVYGDEPVQSRKYSELKAYLYDLILRTLQQYDEQSSSDYELKRQLLSVRSLFRRGLFADCDKLMKRVKKTAYQQEEFGAVLEVLDWEKQLAYAIGDVDFLDMELERLQEEEQACLDKIGNLRAVERLFYQTYTLVRKNTVRSANDEQVVALQQHPLLQSETTCLSYRARLFYVRTLAILCYQVRDLKGFYTYSDRLVQLLESHRSLLKENASLHIAALSNLATSCGHQGYYQEMRVNLAKLKKVKPITKDDTLKIHRQYYTNYFSLCINTGAFGEGLVVLEEHLKDRKKLDRSQFERSSFYFQYFYIYFGTEQFTKALDALNDWLDLPRSVEQLDLQHLSKLLYLITHFELGNYMLLESLLRSTQRNLRKLQRYNTFEQLLIQCLRLAIQQPDNRKQQEVFAKYSANLKETTLSRSEKAAMRFFDFASWLEGKATRRPLAEMIQEKLKQQESTT